MPKDFKNAPSPRAEPKGLAHPMLIGILIGLLLGIIIALGVALWLNRLSNPFIDKPKPLEPLQRMTPKGEPAAARPSEPAPPQPAGKPGERPRFEFYQILPGEKETAPAKAPAAPGAPATAPAKDAKPAPAPAAAVSAKGAPGSSPSSPKAASGEAYFLQAGAYATEADADNMKARIAFVGLEAQVKPVNVADKGTLYRVRLGPYQSLEDANRIKAALSQNGVAAAIIKSSDAN
jgi:cell division protein FtsN